jgi:hypothetical protein
MKPRLSSLIAVFICVSNGHLFAEGITVELQLGGRTVQGTPLAWSNRDVTLLARDGNLLNFPTGDAKNYRKVADGFQSLSQGAMRAELAGEFGNGFEVSGTGTYLVVHPVGQRGKWASRFEELYRSFVHYFTARGLQPGRPQFPLVAVVFPSQQDFLRYAASTGARLLPGTLGYYSPTTNRILVYDVTAGRGVDDGNWHVNAETIIHEAAHQAAFNTGIHSRYTMPPRWVAEGLGTMFEARGVWNSRRFSQQRDRINKYRLAGFTRYASSRRPKGSLAEFVSSDRIFQTDADGAYAEAWALTFFLVETRPRQYKQFLQATATRPNFTIYRSPERLKDFTDAFGSDLRMVEAHFLRFMAEMK